MNIFTVSFSFEISASRDVGNLLIRLRAWSTVLLRASYFHCRNVGNCICVAHNSSMFSFDLCSASKWVPTPERSIFRKQADL
jgi:hypothetical protein